MEGSNETNSADGSLDRKRSHSEFSASGIAYEGSSAGDDNMSHGTAEAAKVKSRSERKRHRERKRRSDVNRGCKELMSLLFEIDPSIRPESKDEELSRVDLIISASTILRKVYRENLELKNIIGLGPAARPRNQDVRSLPALQTVHTKNVSELDAGAVSTTLPALGDRSQLPGLSPSIHFELEYQQQKVRQRVAQEAALKEAFELRQAAAISAARADDQINRLIALDDPMTSHTSLNGALGLDRLSRRMVPSTLHEEMLQEQLRRDASFLRKRPDVGPGYI